MTPWRCNRQLQVGHVDLRSLTTQMRAPCPDAELDVVARDEVPNRQTGSLCGEQGGVSQHDNAVGLDGCRLQRIERAFRVGLSPSC